MSEKANSVVLGLGEVGGALFRILSNKYDTAGYDKNLGGELPKSCKHLNICFPYFEGFVEEVNRYVALLSPELVIIHSTVPVGTTKKIKGLAVHSPVRGKHPQLFEGLKRYDKYVGYNDAEAYALAIDYLDPVFTLQMIQDSNATELMKIVSLAKYLVYLAVTEETNELCKALNVPYAHIKNWERTQNEVVNEFYADMKWPILTPPEGKVGGHCVMPVSTLFLKEAKNAQVNTTVVEEAFTKFKRD